MDASTRHLLAEFLKTRRARLAPEQAGFATGTRRRTRGLRREEVAQLAGVSVTWYTWMEQARDIQFSPQVLDSLARALQLPPHEKQYLFALVGWQTDAPAYPQVTLNPSLVQIVAHQGDYPAYVMGRFWQILAWNSSASGLFGDFSQMPFHQQNMLGYTFTRPATRALVLNWEERAPRLLAEFRADCSRHPNDPWLHTFIEQMKQMSLEFDTWWSRHDVGLRDGGRRDFQHPLVGRLALEQTTLRLSHDPDIKVVIHVPLDEFDTASKLKALAV